MKKQKKIRNLFLMVFLLTFLCGTTVLANQTANISGRNVKIGYSANDQLIKQDKAGKFYGYGVEYLEKISEYTGWIYDYVQIKEEDREQALEDGTVDIICNAHKLDTAQDRLYYSEESSVLEYALLCTQKDNSHIFFEDYNALRHEKIGVNRNSHLEKLFDRYDIRHNLDCEKVYFDDYQSMKDALDNHEISAMLVSSLRDIEKYKLVAKVGIQNEYFVVSQKQYFMMYTLNAALEQLSLTTPFYSGELYEKYYGKPSNKLNGITREEYYFIHSGRKLRVAYDPSSYPVEYYNEETGLYDGIYADAMDLIAKESGFAFEFVPVKKFENAFEMLDAGSVDLIAGTHNSKRTLDEHDIAFSAPYLNAAYSLVCKMGNEAQETYKLALPKAYVGVQNYFREEKSDWEIVEYDSVDACLKAVEKGEAGATAVNTVFLQTAYNLNDYEGLIVLTTRTESIPISLGIGHTNRNMLKGILDKTILAIPGESFEKCITENAINIAYDPPLSTVILKFSPYILSLILVLTLAAFSIIKGREKHFRHLAMTDSVTKLYNGVKFRKEGSQLLNHNKQESYLMISLDIDRFKFVNNDFGQAAANNLLRMLGERIQNEFKEEALYARDMADMFLIMTKPCEDLEQRLGNLNEDIYFESNGNEQYYKMSLKFGVCAIEPRDKDEDIITYIDMASVARKSTKGSSRTKIAYYDDEMKGNIEYEVEVERTMEAALKNREFVVYFQPKYDLHTGVIIGAEALVRWMSPEKGLIPPDKFIPIFEKNGFIVNLDFYVYEETVKKIAQWKEEGKKTINISVNVSRVHAGTVDFLPRLIKLVDSYGINRKQLELELTETILGSKKVSMLSFVKACKDEGFEVSIDDFGSGYSSLNVLKELPVDVLKIDKGFLDETEGSERSSIIVEEVVDMARKIGIVTLCEGVETEKQEAFLKRIGCDMAQGYLYSKPIPAEEFEKLF